MGMGVASGSGGKRGPAVPVVNVTPLVDVALVVLIIFMVVTPLSTKTFWLNLPKQEEKDDPTPPDPNNQPLVLTVDKAGVMRVNKTVLSADALKQRLPRMLAAKRQKVLYFDAHDAVSYGQAVAAMDLSRQSGARSIAMLTQPIVK
jgi:biopolymer transport protein TolR